MIMLMFHFPSFSNYHHPLRIFIFQLSSSIIIIMIRKINKNTSHFPVSMGYSFLWQQTTEVFCAPSKKNSCRTEGIIGETTPDSCMFRKMSMWCCSSLAHKEPLTNSDCHLQRSMSVQSLMKSHVHFVPMNTGLAGRTLSLCADLKSARADSQKASHGKVTILTHSF